MKKLQHFVIICFTLIASCDQALDIDADGTISGDVLSNTARLEEALLGAYFNLGGISDGALGGELLGGDFALIATLLAHDNDTELSWDDVNGPDYSNFIDKEIINTNIRVEANWLRAYETINAVNNVLANIQNADDANRNRIQGEALAIRGLLYFEMVRLWAPQFSASATSDLAIPILLDPVLDIGDIESPSFSTVDQVYTQAENDLMAASTLLQPFGTNGTRISHFGCEAYLARLFLQKGVAFIDDAFDHANTVISSNQFSLTTSPIAAFNNSTNSTEDIFAIQQTSTNTAGDIRTGTGIVNFFSSITGSGLGAARIIQNSFDSNIPVNSPRFGNGDLRGSIDTGITSSSSASDIVGAFYQNLRNNDPEILSPAKFSRADQVLPVLRLAEMHLIRAEAIFEQNPLIIDPLALDDLNEVRTRAGLTALAVSDFGSPFVFFDSLNFGANSLSFSMRVTCYTT